MTNLEQNIEDQRYAPVYEVIRKYGMSAEANALAWRCVEASHDSYLQSLSPLQRIILEDDSDIRILRKVKEGDLVSTVCVLDEMHVIRVKSGTEVWEDISSGAEQ